MILCLIVCSAANHIPLDQYTSIKHNPYSANIHDMPQDNSYSDTFVLQVDNTSQPQVDDWPTSPRSYYLNFTLS